MIDEEVPDPAAVLTLDQGAEEGVAGCNIFAANNCPKL